MNLYTRALCFAAKAHDCQLRQFTGAPYISHPIAVAETIRTIGGTEEMVAAALLHDVVEDSNVPIEMIEYEFGEDIAALVDWLTDPIVEGNRAVRKAFACELLSHAPGAAQTIKVADLLDNTASITEFAPKFARVYLLEKQNLLDVMKDAHPELRQEAYTMTRWALANLNAKPSYFE